MKKFLSILLVLFVVIGVAAMFVGISVVGCREEKDKFEFRAYVDSDDRWNVFITLLEQFDSFDLLNRIDNFLLSKAFSKNCSKYSVTTYEGSCDITVKISEITSDEGRVYSNINLILSAYDYCGDQITCNDIKFKSCKYYVHEIMDDIESYKKETLSDKLKAFRKVQEEEVKGVIQ